MEGADRRLAVLVYSQRKGCTAVLFCADELHSEENSDQFRLVHGVFAFGS